MREADRVDHAVQPMTTVLVTGATDGLGLALARELAQSGDTVLIHGRDRSLRAIAPWPRLGAAELYLADFASLAQIRVLATRPGGRGARRQRGLRFGEPARSARRPRAAPPGRLGRRLLARGGAVAAARGQPRLRRARRRRVRRPDDRLRLQPCPAYCPTSSPGSCARSYRRGGRDRRRPAPRTVMLPPPYRPARRHRRRRPARLARTGPEGDLALVRRPDVSGRCFSGLRPPLQRPAFDPDARARLRALATAGGELPRRAYLRHGPARPPRHRPA